MSTIAEKIKKIVEEQSRSLAWLAQQVGMTKVGFYKMLDNNSIKVETLEKIANVLGVPVMVFYGFDVANALEHRLLDADGDATKYKPFLPDLNQPPFNNNTLKQKDAEPLNKRKFAFRANNVMATSFALFDFYEDVQDLWAKASEENWSASAILGNMIALIRHAELQATGNV